MKSGRFISFEGGEGTGKTTQVTKLTRHLVAAGLGVVETREPGGTPAAEEIRRLLVEGDPKRWEPLSELLLHFAARREHLDKVIWPALHRGQWVVSDRFADSTRAYQGSGLGLPSTTIETLYDLSVGDFAPDLTFILDLPAEIGLRRAKWRGDPSARYERMGQDFHERLREGFLAIAKAHPDRCRVIDATGTPEAIETAIWRTVAERFELLS